MTNNRIEPEIIDVPVMIFCSTTDFDEFKVNKSVVSAIPASFIADMLLKGFNLSRIETPTGN